MTLSNVFVRLMAGFLFAALALGLLPFLLIHNLAEVMGLSGLYTSPLVLLQKLYPEEKKG